MYILFMYTRLWSPPTGPYLLGCGPWRYFGSRRYGRDRLRSSVRPPATRPRGAQRMEVAKEDWVMYSALLEKPAYVCVHISVYVYVYIYIDVAIMNHEVDRMSS